MEPGYRFDGPRRIRPDERQDGYRLFAVCFGHQTGSVLEDTEGTQEDGGWYVMLPTSGPQQGKPVSQINISHSQVSFGGSRLQVGSIGGVCTHPDFRGLGLAGRILEHCTYQLKEEGARLMLISGERGLYTRTGNVQAMRFSHFRLQAGGFSRPDFWPEVTLRPYRAGDAAACAHIYQSEAVGYLRSLDEYPDDFPPGSAWLVELHGAPAAYLNLRTPWEFWDGQEHGIREVTEYAGSRLALAAGISQLLTGTGDPARMVYKELRQAVPWQDLDFLYLLQALGQPAELSPLGGHTLRLINFPALRDDLDRYIAARLPDELCSDLHFEQSGPLLVDPDQPDQTGDRCAIHWKDQRLELSTADMTRLVFGNWQGTGNSWTAKLPSGSPLVEIVNTLFPLPSFQPGLNYR